MVGVLHKVEFVFHDDDAVAVVDESLEHVDQFALVLLVEARRRLVQQIERVTGLFLAEFLGEFHALGLAARQRRRRLAERHVAEANVLQEFESPSNL
ncbi:MAG: hypothetical protein A07HN63_00784 [uncultured archaeon A07HN63]|nr:MAG: hypothetical protein A07HN63_00784 [uncultured archaeon A07HN63]